jgi:hypothetical protein
MAPDPKGYIWTENLKIDGDRLVAEFKRLVAEGNVRRITIKQGEHIVVELPLTVGVVGALLAPWLAAVGAIAALVTDCSIVIERMERGDASHPEADPSPVEATPVG